MVEAAADDSSDRVYKFRWCGKRPGMAMAAAAAARPGAEAAEAAADWAWGLLGCPEAAAAAAAAAAAVEDTDDVGDDPSDAELALDIGGEKAVGFSSSGCG